MKKLLYFSLICFIVNSYGQDVIPKAKTKAEKAKEKKSIEEKIESVLPVDVQLPSAKAKLGKTEINTIDDAKKLVTETLPDLGLKLTTKAKKLKKELLPVKPSFDGKTYESIAVEKVVVKKGVGEKLNYEEFYVLKKEERLSPYVKDIHWYDERSGKILNTLLRNQKRTFVLHGPYKRWIGSTVVEEGHYFLGAKHKRWIQYDKNFNIVDKQVWNKGFLNGSKLDYYDADSVRLKEVLPIAYGKKTGPYFAYFENGSLSTEGFLDDSVAVGKWTEYYETSRRTKKEIQYGKHRFDTAEPYVLREYDEGGKLIYEAKK